MDTYNKRPINMGAVCNTRSSTNLHYKRVRVRKKDIYPIHPAGFEFPKHDTPSFVIN